MSCIKYYPMNISVTVGLAFIPKILNYIIIRMQAETAPIYTNTGVQLVNLNRIQSKPRGNHCGYCDKYGSCSWGLSKQTMHPYTYQLLAERGWRRCGTYYYKPDIKQSCCKLWTHRMNVNGFKIKKDQRKTVRSIVEWLMCKMDSNFKKELDKKHAPSKAESEMKTQPNRQEEKAQKNKNKGKMVEQIPEGWTKISLECAKLIMSSIGAKKEQFLALILDKMVSKDKASQFQCKFDLEKVKCFMSQPNQQCDFYGNHLMLLFGINKKLFKKDYQNVDFVKDVKEFIETRLNMHKIAHIEAERSGYLLFTEFTSPKMKKRLEKQQQIKQNQIKHSEKMKKQKPQKPQNIPEKPKLENQHDKKAVNPPAEDHLGFELSISSTEISFGPLFIRIVPAEVATQSWRMYQRYCEEIHQKPEKSQSSYSGFLCEKGLTFISEFTEKVCNKKYNTSWDQQEQRSQFASEVKGKRVKLMGCYHMKYYIEKQLIGVGVVDLLPHGLSSVYFFYEPKYKDLRLGVFSSLIEIEYVRWLSLSFPEYQYYYMGFYIQNSQKMNYKGNYQPFDLLCPVTYQFVECTAELRQLIDKIEKKQVESVQLSKNNNKIADMNFQTDIGVYISQKIKIKYEGKSLTLKDLNPKVLIPVLGILKEMVQVWGKQVFQIFTFTF